MNSAQIVFACIVLAVLLLMAYCAYPIVARIKENYGPPPGARRALSPEELGDRGWVSWPYEYNANTASSISRMVERSA